MSSLDESSTVVSTIPVNLKIHDRPPQTIKHIHEFSHGGSAILDSSPSLTLLDIRHKKQRKTKKTSHHRTNSPPHPPQQDRLHHRKIKKTNTRNTTPLKPHTAPTTPAKTPLTKQDNHQTPTKDSDLTCRFPQVPNNP